MTQPPQPRPHPPALRSLPPRRREPLDTAAVPKVPIDRPVPGGTIPGAGRQQLRIPGTAHAVKSVDASGTLTGAIPVVGNPTTTATVGPNPPGARPMVVSGTQAVVPDQVQIPVPPAQPAARPAVSLPHPRVPLPPSSTGTIPRRTGAPIPSRRAGAPIPPRRGGAPIPSRRGGAPLPSRRAGGSLPPRRQTLAVEESANAYLPGTIPVGGARRTIPPRAGGRLPAPRPRVIPFDTNRPSRRALRESPELAQRYEQEILEQAELEAKAARLAAKEARLEALLASRMESGQDLDNLEAEELLEDDDETWTEKLVRKSGRFGGTLLFIFTAARWAILVVGAVVAAGLLVLALDRSSQADERNYDFNAPAGSIQAAAEYQPGVDAYGGSA